MQRHERETIGHAETETRNKTQKQYKHLVRASTEGKLARKNKRTKNPTVREYNECFYIYFAPID